ncbi:triggering receptor expressed on myeloid cells 1-like isoform X4 [Mus caroli]|uniref:Triggering receptor expressed on myeloid cells 1-like isoform X4 n=1 Tax=Mus caroli TaxID=10089 RepID=A0A6P5NS81_MUSCR|nr:triggering receptor expressed on myeloid cells 1-like isoform X4 [Mus caroli]
MAWEQTYLLSPVLLLLLAKGAEKLRYSIRQSSRLNYFTLTMTKLRMSDSGIYHCGIATKNRLIYLRTIHLVVSKGELPLPCGSQPSWLSHPFRLTKYKLSIADQGSVSSVIIPVACGLLSKTLVFTVLFIVTQKSFGQHEGTQQ